jgi:XTP/dITP diphosphohydrolase
MKQLQELVLATHNPAKITELTAMLAPYSVKLTSSRDLGLPEPEETGTTFQENALLKAKFVAEASGKPALADDSGLGFYALDGFPGVNTAPYRMSFPTVEDCFHDLHERLKVTGDNRAYIHCSLCLYYPDGHYQMFDGRIEGQFVYPVRGSTTEGYHFDIVFQPNGYDQTYAELGLETKNKISHRARSFQQFIDTCLKAA